MAVTTVRPMSDVTRGYASRAYALSLAEGATEVLTLSGCGGNLLLRPIADSGRRDAAGCYPMFVCDWSALSADLQTLPDDLVALTLVTEPFCPLPEHALRRMFRVVRALGPHYVVDLAASATAPSRHHRRKLRGATQAVAIDIAEHPRALLPEWLALYETLVRKHRIRGRRRFSPEIFAAQFDVPGTVVFTARRGGLLLGADWYFEDGERVFAHLSAYSDEGYAGSVSYPLMAAAIEHFRGRAAILDLGGTPSLGASGGGLAAFKAGWATRTLPSYLCGTDLLPDEYRRLSAGRAPSDRDFFPYYRRGEY